MDDQGAGGSSRGGGTNPDRSQIRESSLPSTLLQYLYDGPRHSTSQRIAPLMDIPWPNHPTRSHSRDRGRSLPSPSHLLLQTGPRFDHDRVILSRSLDASPVNPVYIHNPDSPLPRLGLQRQLPPVGIDDPPRPPVDRPMGRYSHPPISRSMSASPLESYRRPHSHVPQHGSQSTSRTPQPLRPPSRQVGPSSGVRDALIDDVGVLPQPEVPDRTLGELYAEMGRSPGFSPVQRRGRSEVRATHTSRPQRTQVQTQGRRMIVEQGPVEGFLRDPQRQVEQIPSRPIRGTCPARPLVFVSLVNGVYRFGSCGGCLDPAISLPVPFLISNGELIADRQHDGLFIRAVFSPTDRRPPILNPTNQNPFEGQRRAQRPSPQLQRLQVHHQPQPQQPVRIPPLLSGPGYQRIVGTSSSPQLASTGESQKVSRFSGELYSGGQSEIKPLHQGSSKAEHPVIETQGGVPERKKVQRSPGVKKEPGTPTVESGSGSTSTGATSSTRKKAASKVTVACDFCRGEHLCFRLMVVFVDLIRPPIAIFVRTLGHCGIESQFHRRIGW